MPATQRRALALALAISLPADAFARVLPAITLPPADVLVLAAVRCDGLNTGSATIQPANADQGPGSPALRISPVFHTGSTLKTAWGVGWTSEEDQFIELTRAAATWHGGAGERLTFVVSNYDAVNATVTLPAAPLYRAPTGVFSVLTTVEHSSGTPTSVLLKDPDGTSRLFTAYESTGVLRLDTLMDRYGSQVTHERDGQGRLTRVEDTHGRYIDLTYDAQGMVSGLSDSGGRVTTYAYDAQGRKTGESGPTGTLAYEYDAQGRMTKITYPDGGVKNYAYDAQGRIASEDDGSGRHRLAYAYHPSSTVVTDALGRREVHEFVSRQGWKKPSRVVDAHGGVTRYEYDAAYNLAAVTDPLGRVTRYSYDAQGNATTIVDPAGGIARAAYEPVYARPTRLVDPLGRGLDLDYDSVGNLTQATDALGQSARKQYDAQGHLTRDENPLGQATLFSYEPSNGALKTVSDPLSRQTVMLTDPLSRVTRNTDPAGKAADYEYDAAGNLTKVTDALGGVTEYGYAPGRENKRLSTVKDAKNQTTSFGYDAQGRLTSVVNALNQARSSAYDLKGNLIQTTNARGQAVSYAYDALDRLKTKTAPEGVTSYQYDAAGNLTKVTSYNGSVIELSYDALNRVSQSKQTLPNGYTATLGYSYDAAGNRTGMSTPWGSFSYAYDALNRLTSLTNPQGRTFTFEYDAAGRRTALNYPNGVRAVYSYDAAGQLLGIIHTRTADSTILAKSTYSYDAAGNRVSMTDLAGTHGYGYDDLHRLISASHPDQPNESFTYDAVGNRLADHRIGSYTYDAANRLVENSSYTYTYDADGNMTSKTDKATLQTTSYGYDSENRLVSASLPGGESWTYRYDGQGRRVEKSSGTLASQGTRYVYDGQAILSALELDDALSATFTHGPRIDEPLLIRQAGGDEYTAHAGLLGSIVAHADTGGQVVERIDYEAYGKPRFSDLRSGTAAAEEESFTGSSFAFTGREHDSEIGFLFHRTRHYDTTAGRFVKEDVKVETNRYSYVTSSPTNYTDPLGLAKCLYSVSLHTMVCISNDALRIRTLGPEGVYSGEGECRNSTDPKCTARFFSGPIPPGNYNINPDDRRGHEGFFRLEPNPRVSALEYYSRQRRSGFMLHPGTTSLGCITLNRSQAPPESAGDYIELWRLLTAEMGANTLEVIK